MKKNIKKIILTCIGIVLILFIIFVANNQKNVFISKIDKEKSALITTPWAVYVNGTQITTADESDGYQEDETNTITVKQGNQFTVSVEKTNNYGTGTYTPGTDYDIKVYRSNTQTEVSGISISGMSGRDKTVFLTADNYDSTNDYNNDYTILIKPASGTNPQFSNGKKFYVHVTKPDTQTPTITEYTLADSIDSTIHGKIYRQGLNFYSDSSGTNKITSITPPTRSGYTFLGYYGEQQTSTGGMSKLIDENGDLTNYVSGFMSLKGSIVYAQWEEEENSTTEEYKIVHLDLQGGDGTAPNLRITKDGTVYVLNENVWNPNIHNIGKPIKEGFEFKGYALATTGIFSTNFIIDENGTVADTSIVANLYNYITKDEQGKSYLLYAIWESQSKTFMLDSDGATTDGTTILYYSNSSSYTGALYLDSNLTKNISSNPITLPTKKGYKFKGYYSPSDSAAYGNELVIDENGRFVGSHSGFGYQSAVAKWEERTITGISVSANPTKTTYVVGEDLDLEGGKITATYDNGETEEILMTSSDVSVTGYNKNSIGTQELTVVYEGKTAKFNVIVKNNITGISVSANPTKTTYVVGEDLDLEGGKITATYDNGETEEILMTSSDVSVTGYNKNSIGIQELTVTYKEKTAGFTVNVEGKEKGFKVEATKDTRGNKIIKIIITDSEKEVSKVTVDDEEIEKSEDGEYIFAPSKNGNYVIKVTYKDNITEQYIYEETRFESYDPGEDDEKSSLKVEATEDEDGNKNITISSTNSEKEISKVTVNGEEIEKNEDGKYIFTTTKNGDYTIKVTYTDDTTETYVYTEKRFTDDKIPEDNKDDKNDKEDDSSNQKYPGKQVDTTTANKVIPKTGLRISIIITAMIIGISSIFFKIKFERIDK